MFEVIIRDENGNEVTLEVEYDGAISGLGRLISDMLDEALESDDE